MGGCVATLGGSSFLRVARSIPFKSDNRGRTRIVVGNVDVMVPTKYMRTHTSPFVYDPHCVSHTVHSY